MRADSKLAETLFVTISEIEHGLFHATYRSHDNITAARRLPPYQVGSSIADVKARIALSAQASGYATIVWDASQPSLDAMPVAGDAPAEHAPS